MRFSVEWVSGGTNACAEERATLCDLRIFVGETNACVFYDAVSGEKFEQVTVPAVHLAEGIAADWWAIFGGRDREHPLLPYRTGFVLPDLSFKFDGSTFEVAGRQLSCPNPNTRFWQAGSESLSRGSAESVLSDFIDQVVEKLAGEGIPDSETALAWSRVSESRNDPDEYAFCEAAGALGADPYAISDPDADFIQQAGGLFSGEALIEFLAGVETSGRSSPDTARNPAVREEIIDWVRAAEARPPGDSILPELHDAASQIGGEARRRSGERAWAPGYRAARAFRSAIGAGGDDFRASPSSVAERLGGRGFRCSPGPSGFRDGVLAVVSRDDDVRIHLRERRGSEWASWAENFAFARAIGDAVCFPEPGRSVVNRLRNAERQAAGRAFGAEFLAPVERVLDMVDEGLDVDEISGSLNVSPQVIEHQIENRDRIRDACAHLARDASRRQAERRRGMDRRPDSPIVGRGRGWKR